MFEPNIYFQFSHAVIDPETQVTLFEAGDVVSVEALNWHNRAYGLEEFCGRVMYCESEPQFKRLINSPVLQ